MNKTEYAASITANQTAISAIRVELRKLRNIEKMSKSFSDLKLVDTDILNATITEKKAALDKLRSEVSKARRIVKRMSEIENIEAGKEAAPKAKKSTSEKKAGGAASKKSSEKKTGDASTQVKKQADKPKGSKAEQPAASVEAKETVAA